MLREYEFTVVAKADLPEADKQKLFTNYEEIMKRDGGEFVKRDDWGSKRLAFPIRKNFRGHYMFYDLASSPANIAECERLLRIDENVLRYMVVKIADSVDAVSYTHLMTETNASLGVDFSGLILGFCSAALSYLGLDGQAPDKNLILAKQNIDILEMLQMKTKGNLSAEEERLLSEVLRDLRMKFVEASK